jgi:hypothetical protein
MEHLFLNRGSIRGTMEVFTGSWRDKSRKALEMEHLSVYKGRMREPWRVRTLY